MSEPLHIVFNEDIFGDNLGDKFSIRLDTIKLSYLQVKDLQQFHLLLSLLDDEQEFYVWIHPNNSLKKYKGLDSVPQEDIAKNLKAEGRIRFNIVTRIPNAATRALADSLGVNQYKVGDMWEVKNREKPQKVRLVRGQETGSNGIKKSQYKFAIVSALFEHEYETLLDFLEPEPDFKADGTIKAFKIKGSDKLILAAFQSEMGMTDASILSTYIIKTYQPEFIFMNGVCGGRRSKTELLDIIIPNKIYDYQTGKLEGGTFKPYLRVTNINNAILKDKYNDVHLKMQKECTQPFKNDVKKINFRFESMACGSKVIKTDKTLEDQISKIDEKTVAVDMESYSVVRAAEHYTQNGLPVTAFVIKSVMDYTDEAKNDNVKATAAYFSSLFTIIFIRDFLS